MRKLVKAVLARLKIYWKRKQSGGPKLIFEADIPELRAAMRFPGVYTNFLLGRQAPTYAGQAMLTSFVRSVEAAMSQYRTGRFFTLRFVGESQNISSFFDASCAFEVCIWFMVRAIRYMAAIRTKDELSEVSEAVFDIAPPFMADEIGEKLRAVRNAMNHSDQQVFDGRIAEGTPFMLRISGTETSTPKEDAPDQTTMTWDSVTLGSERITFAELAVWLEQMAAAAEAVVEYHPTKV